MAILNSFVYSVCRGPVLRPPQCYLPPAARQVPEAPPHPEQQVGLGAAL